MKSFKLLKNWKIEIQIINNFYWIKSESEIRSIFGAVRPECLEGLDDTSCGNGIVYGDFRKNQLENIIIKVQGW
jgi:hypothetical protein